MNISRHMYDTNNEIIYKNIESQENAFKKRLEL